ncbi:MAG: polyprenyl synthetase family protein [Chloroflexota bacterium]
MASADLLDTLTPMIVPAILPWIAPVQSGMQAVEARLRQAAADEHILLTAVIDGLLRAGGKRVRPALCLLSAGSFDADFENAVVVAAGIELLHTATLVHDDLIDGASMRRSAPTLNSTWDPDAAVLAGDYLFSRAANLVLQAGDLKVMELFVRTLMVVLNGEIAQRFSRWQIDRKEYYQRIYAKTAAMFVLAMQAPAILAQAESELLEAIVEYGHDVGMAFQIVDDVLDISGSIEQVGKPIGSDLRQGLFTLPAIIYAEANPDDADLLVVLNERDGNHPAIERLIEKVRRAGAVEAAMEEARRLAAQGQSALARLPDSVYVSGMFALAETVVKRQG